MQLNYDNLIAALKCGREFDFTWKENTFSISCDYHNNYPTKWFLAIPAVGIVIEDSNVVNLMEKVKFGLESFKDIVPKIKDSILY